MDPNPTPTGTSAISKGWLMLVLVSGMSNLTLLQIRGVPEIISKIGDCCQRLSPDRPELSQAYSAHQKNDFLLHRSWFGDSG